MIATFSRAIALALLLAILAIIAIAYASTTSYATPPHATCVRVDRAHVGAMAVQLREAC